MDIYSIKFRRIVILILLVDTFFIGLMVQRGDHTGNTSAHWDFRINELRRIEATPRVRALNSEIHISTESARVMSHDWVDIYFPGQSVPLTAADTWRIKLPNHVLSPRDQAGKVL